jgi:long-chain acyl-CoA synthetase
LVTLSEQAQAALVDPVKKAAMEQEFQSLLSSINPQLDKHEKLCCLVVLGGGWTMDNNMMTPTLKIKRDKVEAAYQQKFSTWAQSKDQVIWSLN